MKTNRLFILAIMAVIGLFAWVPQAAGQEQGGPLPEVGVITVTPEDVTLTQELNGRVTPFLIAEVRPQVNGIILNRLFDEGSEVKEDQPLYQIDPAMYAAQLARAEAQLAKAYANVSLADAKLARYDRLLSANAVNKQEFDEVEAASKQAVAELGIAEAEVRVAQINVDYAKVLSPISGRIGKSAVTQGALVNANQADPLAVVQQLDPIYVDVAQPITALLNISTEAESMIGMFENTGKAHAAMRLVLSNGETYKETGKVLFAEVTVDQTTGSVSLRAEFPNPDHILLPGMYVSALLDATQIKDAITVPQRAVMRDTNGTPYVYVVKQNGEVEKRTVATQRTIDTRWLLREGLSGGETIILEGVQRVRFMPGAPAPRVKPVPVEQK